MGSTKSLTHHRWCLIGIVLLALLVSSCSAVGFFYNRLDKALLKEANKYLDLNSAQYAALEKGFARQLETHRSESLPEYLRFLDSVHESASDRLNVENIHSHIKWVEKLVNKLTTNSIGTITPTVAKLTRDQQDHLAQAFHKRNEEYHELYLQGTTKKRIERRSKDIIKQIEHWTGPLHDHQRQLVKDVSSAFPDGAQNWLDYTVGKQQEALALLESQPSEGAINEFLNDWWVHRSHRGATLKAHETGYRAGTERLILLIDQSLDDDQRAHLLERIAKYRQELGKIATSS